jgi:hypothetical protein
MSTVSIINTIFDHTKKQTFPEQAKPLILIFKAFMGIDHLELSSEIIAALYPESLVMANSIQPDHSTEKPPAPASELSGPYHSMGGNRRSISFLTGYGEVGFMPENQFAFLGKILSACKCSMNDISLVNTAKQPVRLDLLKTQLQPKIIFLWGISPTVIGLDPALPHFSINTVNGISVIPVPSPDLMSGDSAEGTALKQRLWVCLKKIFNL